jgi:hypothetical protein
MEPFDTFESVTLTPGQEVLLRAPHGVNVIGVVASVDAEARSVTFADGRVYAFPELETEEVES